MNSHPPHPRTLLATLAERLAFYPGVVLTGPRQVGKTTLAREFAARHGGAVVLDLERESDRARLANPELFFAAHRDRLVVLDEVQTMPGLFAALRPEIDADRRPGRFLLLGSAAGRLLGQSAESLAGRVGYLELGPLSAEEVGGGLPGLESLLARGGFPPSYDAANEALSFQWRQDFLRTLVERDLPALGVGVPGATLLRFWRMLAHVHGQVFNASQLALALGGVAHTTVGRYLDVFADALLVRRLPPLQVNLGKRLVKSPKVYVRDCGLLNALLNVRDLAELQGHPAVGAAWEGLVIEHLIAQAPAGAEFGFFRTAAGAEIDLVMTLGDRRYGYEIKFSSAPKPRKGFWQAREDLGLAHAWVVAPIESGWPLAAGVEVAPLSALPVPGRAA